MTDDVREKPTSKDSQTNSVGRGQLLLVKIVVRLFIAFVALYAIHLADFYFPKKAQWVIQAEQREQQRIADKKYVSEAALTPFFELWERHQKETPVYPWDKTTWRDTQICQEEPLSKEDLHERHQEVYSSPIARNKKDIMAGIAVYEGRLCIGFDFTGERVSQVISFTMGQGVMGMSPAAMEAMGMSEEQIEVIEKLKAARDKDAPLPHDVVFYADYHLSDPKGEVVTYKVSFGKKEWALGEPGQAIWTYGSEENENGYAFKMRDRRRENPLSSIQTFLSDKENW